MYRTGTGEDSRQILRVLLIESDVEFGEFVRRGCADQPFAIEQSETLASGLSRLAEGNSDVILLDLTLPDSEGIATLLQCAVQAPDVPIIVFTDSADDELGLEAVKHGAQDFLIKGRPSRESLIRCIRYASERQRHAAARARLAAILSSLGEGVYQLDSQGRCIYMNRSAEEILGWQLSDVWGKDMHRLVHSQAPEEPPLENCLLVGLTRSDTGPVTGESYFTRADGSVIPVHYSSAPLSVGRRKEGVVVCFRDITDQKQAEDVSRHLLIMQQREDFISTLAHDLKTPIVGADRIFSLLLDGAIGALSPRQVEVIGKLRESNHSLLTMIGNLLDVYRYDAGGVELELEEVNLSQLILSCVEEILPLAESKELQFSTDLDGSTAKLMADELAMRRVITNLLSNAIKFTPAGGSVGVKLTHTGEMIQMQIWDNGIGIPLEEQSRLFTRFGQGKGGRRLTRGSGSGLGLHLCRQIVQAHGGTISCESALDHGTTFSVTLPTKVESTQPATDGD